MADHYDQVTLEFLVSGKDPAMVNAVEEPSAFRTTGESGTVQRTEAGSHPRNDVPVTTGKAHDNPKSLDSSEAGDSSREKGGTQRFLAVHSKL